MSQVRKHPVLSKNLIVTGGKGNDIVVFDTVPRFIEMVEENGYMRNDLDSWAGDSKETALRYSRIGDKRLVPEAQKRVNQLQATLPDMQPTWSPDIAGDQVVVPEFLSGIPEHMRRKIPNETISSPLKVVFDTMSSAAISAQALKDRGTTVLALLMRLIIERPIEFWIVNAYSTDPEVGMMIRVPTTPLNLGMASYLLTNVAFTRNFMYETMVQALSWDGTWPSIAFKNAHRSGRYSLDFDTDEHVAEHTRQFFGLKDTDLVIPIAIHKSYTDMWQHPVKWINERLQECRNYEIA